MSTKCALLLSLLSLAAFGCDKNNNAYCDATHGCSGGRVCNVATNQCMDGAADLGPPADGFNSSDAGPTACAPACSGTAPICTVPMCVGCDQVADGEAACAALSATAPHCLVSGAGTGSCVNCRDGSDCSDPAKRICDPTTHACRGCTTDTDCPSLVCDLTYGSTTRGQCVDASKVVYVGSANCDDTKGDSPSMPMCSITKAAMRAGKTVVRLDGSTFNEDTTINNLTITIIGAAGATMRPQSNNKFALQTQGSSNVTVRGITFTSGFGTGGGILCSSGTVSVQQCTIQTNAGYGVDGNNCALLNVDSSTIANNQFGGIRVGNAYAISNNFIVKNGGAAGGSAGGVVINSTGAQTVQSFVNNTIADNAPSGINAGVACGTAVSAMLLNTLFYDNKPTGSLVPSETNCTTLYSATDDAVDAVRAGSNNVNLSAQAPGFLAVGDYHLMSTSPCKDKGATGPDHDFDGQPRPDPTSMKVDIGADEIE